MDVDWIIPSSGSEGYYGVGKKQTLYFANDGIRTFNGLIYFDPAHLPSLNGSAIKLCLYIVDNYAATVDVNIYRVIDPSNKGLWREGNNVLEWTMDGAAWLRRDGPPDIPTIIRPWTNTVGSSIANSIVLPKTGTISLTSSGSGWAESTNLIDDVQKWVTGAAVNQGWYLEVVCNSPNNRHVASFQYSNPIYRPYLKLEP